MQRTLYGLVIGVMFLLTACSETSTLSFDDEDVSGGAAGTFALPVPAPIASARAVDLDALYVRIVFDGQEQTITEEPYIATFSAANGSTLDISVMWYEEDDERAEDLLLAAWSDSLEVNDNTSVAISSDDYLSTGAAFDTDSDGFSNLTERRENSNPYNDGETPINRPDVRIRWVNPVEAPVIDGLYDSIWSDRGKFDDIDGERLSIDNLMINQGALQTNGNAQFRWFAMHDDSNLYVFVLGQVEDISTPIRDSTSAWQDDTVNLFIDGNNSKGDSYDGFDDRHLFVPFLTDPSNPTQNSTVFVNGQFSASSPAFEFATCECDDEVTWEFKLPFSEFNITKDTPFGFEIQVDVDNDGGARDARWGWFHPARTTEDIDNTWTTPSFMGTAIVE